MLLGLIVGLAPAALAAQAPVVMVEFDAGGVPLDPNRPPTCAERRAEAEVQAAQIAGEQLPLAGCAAEESHSANLGSGLRLGAMGSRNPSYASAPAQPVQDRRREPGLALRPDNEIAGVEVEHESSQHCTQSACTNSATIIAGGDESTRDAVREQLDQLMRRDD